MQSKEITQRSCVPFTPFSPVVISCKMIVKYHNQKIDTDIIHWSYSDRTSSTHTCLHLSVFYSTQFYHMCGFVYSPPWSRCRIDGIYTSKLFALLASLAMLFKLFSMESLEFHSSTSLQLEQVHVYIFYILSFIISLHLENKFLA